ncbi:MAG: hypothetical protein LBB73_06035 [Dysgonamonadaceae bacterium]|jgi:hypothetical protein|nr:hypothetical protein [Dysgonamonadaceae bacterium]
MSKYQKHERARMIELIENSELFDGCKGGFVISRKGKDYPQESILLDGNKNLFPPILNQVIEYFQKNKISFWKGQPKNKPARLVLASQIACLNHLFPVRDDKDAVLKTAQIICEDIVDVLAIEQPNKYIAFEVVSDKDHLNECREGKKPTRGAFRTSIDALIYAKHRNGKNYLLPIEWKYTESYGNADKSLEDRKSEPKGANGAGQERLRRYSGLISGSGQLKSYDSYRSSIYFFEPFYQLMRQTLWAEQMIANKETETIKADDFIHVHIIPQENGRFIGESLPQRQKHENDLARKI